MDVCQVPNFRHYEFPPLCNVEQWEKVQFDANILAKKCPVELKSTLGESETGSEGRCGKQ
jgi:hypothetical protein